MSEKFKIIAELISAEFCCVNCSKRESEQVRMTNEETHWGVLKGFVSKEHKCENCGCNTFNVDYEIELKTE